MSKLHELVEKIKELENELLLEIYKKGKEFNYNINGKKVCFEKTTQQEHKTFASKIYTYLRTSSLKNALTLPIIWLCILPAVFMDIIISIYHFICFPIYGIPKVNRNDYIIIDHQALQYLNMIEKAHCLYCGYFVGLIAYVQEIAGRTEQYWCPIKHAKKKYPINISYNKFLEYGDAKGYKENFEKIRNDFQDVKKMEEK